MDSQPWVAGALDIVPVLGRDGPITPSSCLHSCRAGLTHLWEAEPTCCSGQVGLVPAVQGGTGVLA